MMDTHKNALVKGEKVGFDEVEIYYACNDKLELRIFENALDKYSSSKVCGLAIRGVKEGKEGFAYTENNDEESIDEAIKAAYENMKYIDSEDRVKIYSGEEIYEKQQLDSESFKLVDIKEKVKMLFEMEKKAYKKSDKLYKVNVLVYSEIENSEEIINSLSLELSEKRNIAYLYMSVLVRDGEKFRSGFGFKVVRKYEDLDPDKVIESAVGNGLSKIGAKSIKSGKYRAVFKNTAFSELLEAFAGIFIAERVQKGTSRLAGKLGEKIAYKELQLVDDPNMENGIANAGFDAEGVSTKKKYVIRDGILETYLYNIKTATKDNIKSTGNAGRASYKSGIGTTVYNFYIKPGETSFDKGISKITDGIYITELQGLHAGADQISCDFSVSAQGFILKNGEIDRPVSDITVSGNFLDVLKNVESIFDDIDFTLPSGSYFGSPSIEINVINVAGEEDKDDK